MYFLDKGVSADRGANHFRQNLPEEEIGIVNDETVFLDREYRWLGGELSGCIITARREAVVDSIYFTFYGKYFRLED